MTPCGKCDDLAKEIKRQSILTQRPIVFTNGCFDLLHPGHLSTLNFSADLARNLCWHDGIEFSPDAPAFVVVGVNSDDSVSRLKGVSRPVMDLDARIEMLKSLRAVDFVLCFDEDTPERLIATLQPHFVVKGGDYIASDVVGSDSSEVRIAPSLGNYSTTAIIERIRRGLP